MRFFFDTLYLGDIFELLSQCILRLFLDLWRSGKSADLDLPQKCINPATFIKVSTTQITTKKHPIQLDKSINVVNVIESKAKPRFRYNSSDIIWKKKKHFLRYMEKR